MNCFNFLNSRQSTIWFTFKKQNEVKLSFLGVLVSTTEENFGTSVFCNTKSIALDTNFTSFTPFTYKVGLMKTSMHRACGISSFWCLFDKENHKISLLIKIMYLPQLMDRENKIFYTGSLMTRKSFSIQIEVYNTNYRTSVPTQTIPVKKVTSFAKHFVKVPRSKLFSHHLNRTIYFHQKMHHQLL